MTPPALEMLDLQLLVAADDTGSIGGAARILRMSQPSASSRLSRLERRLGVKFFDRGTTGVRATAAGQVLVERARRVLDVVAAGVAEAHQSARTPRVAVGTIASLAPAVFTALDRRLRTLANVVQRSDHGRSLLQAVLDGALDAAVVCLTRDQLPKADVHRIHLGRDPLAMFVPKGCDPPRGRLPLRNRAVLVHLTSGDAERFAARVVRGGGMPRITPTAQTALALARASRDVALVPTSCACADQRDGELIEPSPIQHQAGVTLVIADVSNPATRLIHQAAEDLQRLFTSEDRKRRSAAASE
jgi:DNA-binding transcriptional LysR family regulator